MGSPWPGHRADCVATRHNRDTSGADLMSWPYTASRLHRSKYTRGVCIYSRYTFDTQNISNPNAPCILQGLLGQLLNFSYLKPRLHSSSLVVFQLSLFVAFPVHFVFNETASLARENPTKTACIYELGLRPFASVKYNLAIRINLLIRCKFNMVNYR